MKVKELLSDINAKDEVVAAYDKNDGIVYIYKSGSEDTSDLFFAFDDNIKSLNQVSKIYGYLGTISLDTLRFILDKINEYINTPIEDRNTTQYYAKVTLGAPYPVKMYIKSVSLDHEKAVFKLTDNKKEAKKYNKEALPSCRFDTNFEPVEDDE